MFGDLIASWRTSAMRALQGMVTEQRTVRGIPVTVINTRRDIETSDVFRRLDVALSLIEQYKPLAFARLRRDFARILVSRYPCRAAYFPDTRTCLVELTFSVNPDFTEAQIASSIVHEGVHARVHAMGVKYDESNRPREERLCRTAELEFGRAVPGGEAIVRRAMESLMLDDADVAPAIDWNEARRAVEAADAEGLRRG